MAELIKCCYQYTDPPVVIPVQNDGIFSVQENEQVTLIAFNSSSIDGWPTPQVRWIHPTGQHIYSDTSDQYNIDIPGELIIINVQLSDNGTYNCILFNEVEVAVKNSTIGSLIQEIYLIVLTGNSNLFCLLFKLIL